MPKEAKALNAAARLVPKLMLLRSWLIEAPSLVRTVKMDTTDRTTPTAAISIGARMAFICISGPARKNAEAPRAIVERMEPQYDS